MLFFRWDQRLSILQDMDFIINVRKYTLQKIEHIYINKPHVFVIYPFNIYPIKQYENHNYIIYTGRTRNDKRIDLLIKTIGKSKTKPSLYVVNAKTEYEDYCMDLINKYNVQIKTFCNISQLEKFDLYSKATFAISAHYSFCPSGCLTEAQSIGKNALSFEGNMEDRRCFGPYINYADSNIDKMSELIDKLMLNDEYREKDKEKRINFYNQTATYEIWAKNVYEFLVTL